MIWTEIVIFFRYFFQTMALHKKLSSSKLSKTPTINTIFKNGVEFFETWIS